MGCAVRRLASATNLPMKPVAPIMRTRPLVAAGMDGDVTMVLQKCGIINGIEVKYKQRLMTIVTCKRKTMLGGLYRKVCTLEYS